MSVIRVSRCEVTRGTLSGRHVLTLIWKTMTGGSFKIVLNWAVLTRACVHACARACRCYILLNPNGKCQEMDVA